MQKADQELAGQPAEKMAARPRTTQLDQRASSARLAQLASSIDASSRMAAQRQASELANGSARMAGLQERANNTGLPDRLKAGIESLSGMSMDHVKVHYNSAEPAQLNAHAYAQGRAIHLAPGQERHLPHEAWHLVQQAQGRVRPTMQMKGDTPINDDAALEREADQMGAAALAVSDQAAPAPAKRLSLGETRTVQREEVITEGGVFDSNPYEAHYQENVGHAGQTSLGANMKLSFMPNANVIALGTQKIGLIQTVKTLKSTVATPTRLDTPDTPADSPNKAAYKLTAAQGDLGRGIDKKDESSHDESNTSPLYATANRQDDFPDTLAESNASVALGAHWRHVSPRRPAELFDHPHVALQFARQAWTMSFEVAAVITEGPMTGTYLGSIAWGWKRDPGGVTQLDPDPIRLVSRGVPSKQFRLAGKKWNEWNDGERTGSDGEQHDVVEVPINKARLFSHDKSGLPAEEVIRQLADLMTLEEFSFPRMDDVEKQNALHEIRILREAVRVLGPAQEVQEVIDGVFDGSVYTDDVKETVEFLAEFANI
jgi:hypothetical protein